MPSKPGSPFFAGASGVVTPPVAGADAGFAVGFVVAGHGRCHKKEESKGDRPLRISL